MQKSPAKRASIAGILALLGPGLGQIYNGQLRKGVLVFSLWLLIYVSFVASGALHSLFGLLALLVLVLGLQVFAIIDAIRIAIRDSKVGAVRLRTWRAYALGFSFLAISGAPQWSESLRDRVMGIRAYKIPVDSMAPTLVVGDRMIVDPRAFVRDVPKRGDLIVFIAPHLDSLYTKRVIAVGGDIIQGTPGEVSVNGKVLSEPYTLPTAKVEEQIYDPNNTYGPLTVPAGHLFVLGDNRFHSFDSRQPQFGTVPFQSVRGRPLYIYWSSNRSRIGNRLQ